MKKSIILEAPNGGGKSTLGRLISKELKLQVIHSGPSPGGFIESMEACLLQLNRIKNGNIIDRITPISRRVYDYGKLPEFEIQDYIYFTEEMCKHAVIVYCCGHGDFSKKDYYPDGHYESILSARNTIRAHYEEIMKDIPHLKWDYQFHDFAEFMEALYEDLHSS